MEVLETEVSEMNVPMQIVDSRDATPADLESLYDDILALSFPESELVDRAELLDELSSDESTSTAALAIEPGGTVIGGIVGEWFPSCGVMLLSYLAIRADYRGCGVGTRLFQHALAGWSTRFTPALVLGEVEDPRYYRESDPSGFGDANARLRLYESWGAKILPVPYFQPSLGADQPRVRNLLLMVFAAYPRALKGDHAVDAHVVRCFLEENIARCEGSAADEEAENLRRAAQAKSVLPLLEVSTYLHRDGS
jgi:GNAT superfamily N-acetyltransferase